MFNLSPYLSLVTNWASLLIITLISVYLYSTRNYNYWKSRGVNGPKPLPFIGTVYQIFFRPRLVFDQDNYKKFGKIYGLYNGSKPVLCVAEPELIRDMCVKNFHKLVDRGNISFGHPIFDRSLLTARGEEWKHLRTIVSPTFSSGKIRKMKALIDECVRRLETALTASAKSDNKEINLRQFMVNYTMDVIALCAFATKIDTHSAAEEHPFIRNANVFFKPSMRFGLFFILNTFVPSLVKRFNLCFVSSDVINYFKSALRTIITEREAQKVANNTDFLQLLVDAKNRKGTEDIDEDIKRDIEKINESIKKRGFQLEEIDILATSLIFLLAGYETTASSLSYLLHELALNPEYQQKLFEEMTSLGPNAEYESVAKLPYLDACISETLRKYSPLVLTQRSANEDYELGDTGLVIPKGMAIHIPIFAIHHDPQYYPDPDQFNPDRFMPENKYRLIPYTYLPFGTGPRNCVGMRFALMNIKIAVFDIVSKFKFIRTERTKSVFEYKKFIVFSQALDMGTVGVEVRQ